MLKITVFAKVLLLLGLLLAAVQTVQADDGWRRTAQGWERGTTWSGRGESHRHGPLEPEPIHPAQLAVLEIAAGCLALACFAPSGLGVKRTTDS
jgi:hypothetical protein